MDGKDIPAKPCPSCGVMPNELKFDMSIVGSTAGLQYRHLAGCTIGYSATHLGQGHRCSRCSTEFTLTSETPIRYVDGGGFASLDCPMCWANAEAAKVS